MTDPFGCHQMRLRWLIALHSLEENVSELTLSIEQTRKYRHLHGYIREHIWSNLAIGCVRWLSSRQTSTIDAQSCNIIIKDRCNTTTSVYNEMDGFVIRKLGTADSRKDVSMPNFV